MKGYGHPSAITIGAILLGVTILSTSPSPAQAQATKEEHKLTLRAIMQELGAEYLRLTKRCLSTISRISKNRQRPSRLTHCLTKSL